MRLLLTGGTGLIGRALCAHWRAGGHQLLVWSRRPAEVPGLCAGARGVASLTEIDEPPDAVINLAGAPIADRPWTAARRRLLWQSRVDLTRRLVDWLQALPTPPDVLVSGSATGWYGDRGDVVLDESSPPGLTDFGSELCVAWEQEAERARGLGLRVVLIRTAPVLSSRGGMLARLRVPFSLGLGGPIGNGQQWIPWIHLDDIVGLIDHTLHETGCQGPVNGCAPQAVRNEEFMKSLASAMHRPALLRVPAWPLRTALGPMSVLLLGGQRVTPTRARSIGYRFRHPTLDTALAASLR